MITVSVDGDKVIWGLSGRTRDILLSPDQAERLAEVTLAAALAAELAPPSLATEIWNAQVTNYDGLVVVRLLPPASVVTDRVPLSLPAARSMAGLLKTNAQCARLRVVVKFKNTGG